MLQTTWLGSMEKIYRSKMCISQLSDVICWLCVYVCVWGADCVCMCVCGGMAVCMCVCGGREGGSPSSVAAWQSTPLSYHLAHYSFNHTSWLTFASIYNVSSCLDMITCNKKTWCQTFHLLPTIHVSGGSQNIVQNYLFALCACWRKISSAYY